ncbi:hypothetical protein FGADI_5411 [Fusarium gaditjirri]|uniref:Uncharacterized protein n=1 Tax=Fusarium gaditjirri TaxID=282569 RepID=A0A8H4WX93_9HYPO|nr:hypothetical protein FGADI_5411 [Fusarium gaditjirri]
MSFVKDSPDPGGQPDPVRQAITANAYWARAELIIKHLWEIISERPSSNDSVKTITTICWWIISMGMEFNRIQDQFQQDPHVPPILRLMLRNAIKLDASAGGRVENSPFSEGIGGETCSAGDEMRSVEADAESDKATSKDLETKREKRAARAAVYHCLSAHMKESEVVDSEKK